MEEIINILTKLQAEIMLHADPRNKPCPGCEHAIDKAADEILALDKPLTDEEICKLNDDCALYELGCPYRERKVFCFNAERVKRGAEAQRRKSND